MGIREFYKFYPGSTWIKRTGHLIVMCTIGANIFLNEIQDILLQKSEDLLAKTQLFTRSVSAQADTVEATVVPTLKVIEQYNLQSAIEYYIREFFSIPIRVPKSENVTETVRQVRELDRKTTENTPIFKLAAQVIRWTSILIWFPVLFVAVPWLLLDLLLGKEDERRYTFYGLLIASVVNIIIYHLMRAATSEYINSFAMTI
ncbi:MAG: hypothetical protein ACKV1O_16035 [Saprospiraceae bacterium]